MQSINLGKKTLFSTKKFLNLGVQVVFDKTPSQLAAISLSL